MAAFNAGMGAFYRHEDAKNQNKLTRGDDSGACGCFHFNFNRKASRKTAAEKERIKNFSIWFYETEEFKGKEYVKRRRSRKAARRAFQSKKAVRRVRLCFIPVILLFCTGMTFTLCSLVKTIGKNTPFYNQRELYRILGPLLLFVSLLLAVLVDALLRRLRPSDATGRKGTRFYIKSKNKAQNGKKGETNQTVQGSAISGNLLSQNEVQNATAVTVSSENATDNTFDITASEDVCHTLPIRRKQLWGNIGWMKLSQESQESEISTVSSVPSEDTRDMATPRSDSMAFDNLARHVSNTSKTSATSKFSDFGDTAPLVKKT